MLQKLLGFFRLNKRCKIPLRVPASGLHCVLAPGLAPLPVRDISASGFLVEVPDQNSEILETITDKPFFVELHYINHCKNLNVLTVKVKFAAITPDGIAFSVVSKGKVKAEYEKLFKLIYDNFRLSKNIEETRTVKTVSDSDAESSSNYKNLIDYYTLQERIETVKTKQISRQKTIILLIVFLIFALGQNVLTALKEISLRDAINSYEKQTNSKVVMLVNRRVSFTVFGFPVFNYLTIEDAHSMLRQLAETPKDKNLVIILHTPGGEMTAGMQIARMLKNWQADVKVVVPYYAMSAGTLIALSAREIVMDENAVLGPIDPQIQAQKGTVPAVAVVDVEKNFGREKLSGDMLILWSMSKRALSQMEIFLKEVVLKDSPNAVKQSVINKLLYTHTTHDCPLFAEDLKKIGLSVKAEIPQEIKKIIDLAVPVASH